MCDKHINRLLFNTFDCYEQRYEKEGGAELHIHVYWSGIPLCFRYIRRVSLIFTITTGIWNFLYNVRVKLSSYISRLHIQLRREIYTSRTHIWRKNVKLKAYSKSYLPIFSLNIDLLPWYLLAALLLTLWTLLQKIHTVFPLIFTIFAKMKGRENFLITLCVMGKTP